MARKSSALTKPSPAPGARSAAVEDNPDARFRRARKAIRLTEDEALNALCDSRLAEPRVPLENVLKKLASSQRVEE